MAHRAENIYSPALSKSAKPRSNPSTGLGPYSSETEHYTLIALVLPKLHFDLDLIRLRWEFLLLLFSPGENRSLVSIHVCF